MCLSPLFYILSLRVFLAACISLSLRDFFYSLLWRCGRLTYARIWVVPFIENGRSFWQLLRQSWSYIEYMHFGHCRVCRCRFLGESIVIVAFNPVHHGLFLLKDRQQTDGQNQLLKLKLKVFAANIAPPICVKFFLWSQMWYTLHLLLLCKLEYICTWNDSAFLFCYM